MKKILFALSAMALLICSCGEKEYNLSSATKDINATEAAMTDSLVINGSDGNCTVEYTPEWVKSEMRDSVLVYTVAANTTGKAREDAIVVKCGKSTISFPVSQYAKATKLELPNGKTVSIPREGGTKDLVVVCDGMVTVEGAQEPLKASWSNDRLTLTTAKNDGNRISQTLTLKAGDLTEEVAVTIDGKVCPTCNGKGKITCKACGGKGYSFKENGEYGLGIYGCHACGGRGYSYRVEGPDYRNGSGKVTCPTCKGKGI